MEKPAYVCPHVFNKERPILFVSRDKGEWQFLCGFGHEEGVMPRVVGINHLFQDDPSLLEIADLLPDFEAERDDVKSAWRRSAIE